MNELFTMTRFSFIFLLLCLAIGAQAQNKLTAAQWQQDIDTLQQRLPLLHPNFFTNFTRSDFKEDLENIKAHLSGKSDTQIALELQSVVAYGGDGQTRLDLTELLMQEKVIPFALSGWSDGLYVSATAKRFEQISGTKILTINKLSAEDALKKMGRFVAQENSHTNQRDALSWFRFPVALQMAGISKTDTLTLVVEKRDGKTATVQIYPLDPTKPANRAGMQPVMFQPLQPDLRWQPATGFFTQQWLPADSVLYVQYNHCLSQEMAMTTGDAEAAAKLPAFQTFADSIFAFLAQKPYAKVLVDLRFNPGGTPWDGVKLAQRFGKLPQENRPAQIFVATNAFTQGAAVEVAACFATIAGATLIGEPSGTKPNHFDIVRQFRLPHSQVVVQYSSQYRPVQKGISQVLIPKVLIPVNFEQYRKGLDPVLDFVRNH